jgi:hypothetical protein
MTTLLSILSSRRDAVADVDRWAAAEESGRRGAWRFAVFTSTDVAQAVAAALDTPLSDVAVSAWEQYQAVGQARRDTRRHPGKPTVVHVGPHTVSTTEDIDVDIERGGTHCRLVTLTLSVEIAVNAANIRVEAGDVTDITAGSASATVTLSAGDVRLATGSIEGIDLSVGGRRHTPTAA